MLGVAYQKAEQRMEAREAFAAGRAIIARLVTQFPDWSEFKEDLSWLDQHIDTLDK
jgi:hypothetical protein